MLAFVNLFVIFALWLLKAFVALKFWGWFIIPVFTGAPVLSLVQMLGVTYFTSIILFKGSASDLEVETSEQLVLNGWRALALLLSLLCGFILTYFL